MNLKLSKIFSQLIEASDDSRLVIFVGAGVSRNSGFSSWASLVEKMAKILGIKSSRNYTNDQLLKIPEMLYESSPKKYYAVLREELQKKVPSNALDDMIIQLNPDHIITTNYDTLLEDSAKSNTRLFEYVTIFDDSSLLLKGNLGKHFILKMHGDINEENIERSIVLKESDYLDYDHSHILISTFIKSLLATHVFLFIGYSMSDNNLRLILNWINYLKKQLEINSTTHGIPGNVLLYSKSDNKTYPDKQLQKYYSNNNINLVDLDNLPEQILEYDDENSLTCKSAKADYAVLNAIRMRYSYYNDTDFLTALNQLSYTSFNDFGQILTYDTLKSAQINQTGNNILMYNNSTVVMDESLFNKIKELRNIRGMTSSNLIDSILTKASITKIISTKSKSHKATSIDLPKMDSNRVDLLMRHNRYFSIYKMSTSNTKGTSISDQLNTAYTSYLFFPEKAVAILSKIAIDKRNDYLHSLIKYANLTLTGNNFNANMERIFSDESQLQRLESNTLRIILLGNTNSVKINNQTIDQLAHQQEEIYIDDHHSFFFTSQYQGKYGELEALQFLAYDIYHYIRRNSLMIDVSKTDWNNIFSAYSEMIIETYFNNPNRGLNNSSAQQNYPLSDVDVDIIIKFISTKTLESQLNSRKISPLKYISEETFCQSFINLCRSYIQLDNKIHFLTRTSVHPARSKFEKWVENYLLLIKYSNISSQGFIKILKSLFSLIKYVNVDLVILDRIDSMIMNYAIKEKSKNTNKVETLLIGYLSVPAHFKKLNTPMKNLTEFSAWPEKILSSHVLSLRRIQKNIILEKDPDYSIFFISAFKKDKIPPKIANQIIEYSLESSPEIPIGLFLDGYLLTSRQNYFHKLIHQIDENRIPNNRVVIGGLESRRIDALLFFLTTDYRYHRSSLRPIINIVPMFKFVYSPESFDYSQIDITDRRWQILIIGNLKKRKNRFTKYFKSKQLKKQVTALHESFQSRNTDVNGFTTMSFLESIL